VVGLFQHFQDTVFIHVEAHRSFNARVVGLFQHFHPKACDTQPYV